MPEVRTAICRICTAYCPIEVEIEDGIPTRVSGLRNYALYGGYSCVKGRSLPAVTRNPARLMSSMKRTSDGGHEPIASDQAIAEIAEQLSAIIAEHGPRSVAVFVGQPTCLAPASGAISAALLQAIGSPMFFSAGTIDQPGMHVADACHGTWQGGRIRAYDADAFLLVGGNPVISKQYLSQNPARKLKDGVNGGAKLIVLDPRSTETARRAHVYLPVKPGEDAIVLASIIHVLLRENAVDQAFVDENVEGIEALRRAVEPFTPEYSAAKAGVSAEDIIAAAQFWRNLGVASSAAAPASG